MRFNGGIARDREIADYADMKNLQEEGGEGEGKGDGKGKEN